MAFVLDIYTSSTQSYIKNYLISIIREYSVPTKIRHDNEKISCAFSQEHPQLQACLEAIEKRLPASCFMKKTKFHETEEEVLEVPSYELKYPLNLGLCPACQKEMFDPSSRRYYYPFTSCSHCGGNYSFVHAYPYERINTSFKFVRPCKNCEEEKIKVGIREQHVLNSCHECGVAVRLLNKSNERYANDAGSFRTMFEVAAKAILDNKQVLIKTTMGYRLFYNKKYLKDVSTLMMIKSDKITDNLSLITEEFNALLSIERPVLNVSIKDEDLKQTLGNTFNVKYPDDGFSILLATELQKLDTQYCFYEEADEDTQADILMDYDLEIEPQTDMRLFLNKDTQFIAEGERVSFPSNMFSEKSILSLAHELISVKTKDEMFFDKMEHFNSVNVKKSIVLEGKDEVDFNHPHHLMAQDEASFMSVISEHKLFGEKCIGAYFDEEPSFLYYDSNKVIRIVPAKDFHPKSLLEKISNLRDGSDRLVENLKLKMPEVYSKLQNLQERDMVKLFEATAIILGLKDESMKGLVKEAMKFVGKGGIQVDTHVTDNRFDHIAFLASIISYQLAGVSSSILSYSIFESFGDYFSELLQELKSKTKAENIILCGSHFANQSLFSRMQRNLKQNPPFMNINYPIGKENAVVGGVYL